MPLASIRLFYDSSDYRELSEAHTGLLFDAAAGGPTLTWVPLEQPGFAGHVVGGSVNLWSLWSFYSENMAGENLTAYPVLEVVETSWVPPGVPDVAAWRAHQRLNVIPYVEVTRNTVSGWWATAPHDWIGFPDIYAGDGLTFNYRYTAPEIDARTGLPYDYSYGAAKPDMPLGFAFVVRWQDVTGMRSWAQVVG